MTKTQILKHYGSVKNVAEALNMTTQAVYAWGLVVPPRAQFMIEMHTKGKLKADRAARRKS